MIVEVITPDKKIFEGESIMVSVPGTNGAFQILNSHAPIVSTLTKGVIKIRKPNGEEETFSVLSGLVECKNNKIVILAE